MLILLATAVGSMGLWILFVSGTKPEEMIVGAISTHGAEVSILRTRSSSEGVLYQSELRKMTKVTQTVLIAWKLRKGYGNRLGFADF